MSSKTLKRCALCGHDPMPWKASKLRTYEELSNAFLSIKESEMPIRSKADWLTCLAWTMKLPISKTGLSGHEPKDYAILVLALLQARGDDVSSLQMIVNPQVQVNWSPNEQKADQTEQSKTNEQKEEAHLEEAKRIDQSQEPVLLG
jgi:hypothetical protein